MIVGHYAAALLPYSRLKHEPFWLLLLCANVPEFLWLILALAGVEPTTPASLLDASFMNLRVAMTYSHNLLPAVAQGLLVGAIVFAICKRRELALWCGGLTLLHVLCDLLVGFEHQLLGPQSPAVSLNTYGLMPEVALAIELAFSIGCVAWYRHAEASRGRPLSRGRLAALYGVFVVGVLMWGPALRTPLRATLQSLGIAL